MACHLVAKAIHRLLFAEAWLQVTEVESAGHVGGCNGGEDRYVEQNVTIEGSTFFWKQVISNR